MKHLKDIKDWKECINEVVCGDCEKGMAMIPDKAIDLVLTDPPYRNENQPTKDMRKNGGMNNFGEKLNNIQYEEMLRTSKEQIIWGANNFECIPSFKGFLIWEKGIPFDFTMSMCELASVSEGILTIAKMFKHRISGSEFRQHPTQKPLELMRWILENYSKEGDLICDPFMGSWTTARACKDLGRDFIGFEISEEYCAIGEKRLQQQNLF